MTVIYIIYIIKYLVSYTGIQKADGLKIIKIPGIETKRMTCLQWHTHQQIDLGTHLGRAPPLPFGTPDNKQIIVELGKNVNVRLPS